eukprot:5480466-Prymnesium_polylepis.1
MTQAQYEPHFPVPSNSPERPPAQKRTGDVQGAPTSPPAQTRQDMAEEDHIKRQQIARQSSQDQRSDGVWNTFKNGAVNAWKSVFGICNVRKWIRNGVDVPTPAGELGRPRTVWVWPER